MEILLIIVSILFIVFNNRKNIETNESENQVQVYETDEGYEVYNKNTNEKITNVTKQMKDPANVGRFVAVLYLHSMK